MNSLSDNSDQSSIGLLTEQQCLSSDPLANITLYSFDGEHTDFQNHLSSGNIVLVETPQENTPSPSEENHYLNDNIGLYSYQVVDQSTTTTTTTTTHADPNFYTMKKDETSREVSHVSLDIPMPNNSNNNNSNNQSGNMAVGFNEPNQWSHFHHITYCPQYCRIHGIQMVPYCGYIRCHGGHYANRVSFREIFHSSPKRRKREATASSESKNNQYETLSDLINEKSNNFDDNESLDRIQENILPYIGEYELQSNTLANFNQFNSFDQNKSNNNLLNTRYQKKKRGRKSKKDLL